MDYVLFSAFYEPHMGGVELYTKSMADHLARKGNRVTVVTTRYDQALPACERDADGVWILRLPAKTIISGRLPLPSELSAHRKAFETLEREGFDRVVVNTRFYPHSFEGVRLAARHGVPCVVIDHGGNYLTLDSPVLDWLIRRYEHGMKWAMDPYRPIYAGASKVSARWLKNLGVETRLVVPNAIDVEAFHKQDSARSFREELGLGKTTPIASFVARLTPEKGTRVFMETARLLPEVRFLMAGSGPLEDEVREVVRDQPNLDFLGRLARPDVSALFRESDVLCSPTRAEALHATMLEAASWGTAPIVTRDTEWDLVLTDPSWGVVLDEITPSALASAISALAIERSAAEQKVRREELAAHIAQDLSWEESLRALDAAFASA